MFSDLNLNGVLLPDEPTLSDSQTTVPYTDDSYIHDETHDDEMNGEVPQNMVDAGKC